MSTTITAQPPKLILAKQPVGFTAHTTDAGSPLRIKANVVGSTDADSVAADGSGNATFELSDYLQGLITERYKTAAAPVVYTNNPLPVQVEFHSLVGSPPVVGTEVTSDTFYMLDGCVPKARRKSLYAGYASLLAYMQANLRFASWWPIAEPKRVIPGQKEFINFFQLEKATPTTFHVGVYFTLNTGAVDLWDVFTMVSVNQFEMVYIPCGLEQLGLHLPLGGETTPDVYVVSYTVFVYDPNEGIIDPGYLFTVDRGYTANMRQLYFRNPFGMYETLLCTGQGEQTNELKIEVARTNGHILPDKISWKLDKSDTVKANTGFLTKGQMQWLSDMDFTEAYELIGSVLQPIVFNDLKLPVIHDGEYQYSAELEYEYAYNETTEVG